MSRCDRNCDTYEVDIVTAGIFTNMQPTSPRGTVVKVLGAREYVEIVTLGLSVHISSGECSRMR